MRAAQSFTSPVAMTWDSPMDTVNMPAGICCWSWMLTHNAQRRHTSTQTLRCNRTSTDVVWTHCGQCSNGNAPFTAKGQDVPAWVRTYTSKRGTQSSNAAHSRVTPASAPNRVSATSTHPAPQNIHSKRQEQHHQRTSNERPLRAVGEREVGSGRPHRQRERGLARCNRASGNNARGGKTLTNVPNAVARHTHAAVQRWLIGSLRACETCCDHTAQRHVASGWDGCKHKHGRALGRAGELRLESKASGGCDKWRVRRSGAIRPDDTPRKAAPNNEAVYGACGAGS